MRFSLYTAYHILFKMQEPRREKGCREKEEKEVKKKMGKFKKSNQKGKK